MAKWGFDENVSRVKPHLKGAGSPSGSPQAPTEPPPPRPGELEALPPAEAAPEHRRRSVVRDLMHVSDEVVAAEAEAAQTASGTRAPDVAESLTFPAVALKMPVPGPPKAQPVTGGAAVPIDGPGSADVGGEPEDEPALPARVDPLSAIDPAYDDTAPLQPLVEPIRTPPLGKPAAARAVGDADDSTRGALPKSDSAPELASAVPPPDEDAAARRADIKRRAAGLAPVAPPAPLADLPAGLDDFSDIEAAAQLAADLDRALQEAAEANESLRRDLATALDELARSTADAKRLREKLSRSEAEAQGRSQVVQDLVREMELLEGERDGALLQAADAATATDEVNERLLATERRVLELERALADANARTKRNEEAARTQAAQRTALRAELENVRRERDALAGNNADLEREREQLTRSRQALDEVHRALSEARARAQRIRSR